MEYHVAKTPYLDAPHECKQIQPIAELQAVVNRVDEKLEAQGNILQRLADGLEAIRVLQERDLRREKDIDEVFRRLREMEQDIMPIKLKLEGLAVKMGIVGAISMLIGTIVGAIVIKHLGG